MSLDFSLSVTKHTSLDGCKTFHIEEDYQVFSRNITHNLTSMADACGVYKILWRPEELGLHLAKDLINDLEIGINYMSKNRVTLEAYNPPNGWGCYEIFYEDCIDILKACKENPNAKISVWR